MTTPLTHGTNDNAELRGLAEATEPEWFDYDDLVTVYGMEPPDAAYIAAANPATVLGLLDTIDALTMERDAYARQLAQERHTDARIARVKAIRQETGCGLKEALDIVNGDVALAATTARTLRDQALDALAEVDRLRAENEDLRAGDIPDRIRNEPAMYAAYCYAKRERRDEVEDLRDRIAALESGWTNARDTILNERHQLAEENFGSERINMVLGVLDDNYPTLPTDRSDK